MGTRQTEPRFQRPFERTGSTMTEPKRPVKYKALRQKRKRMILSLVLTVLVLGILAAALYAGMGLAEAKHPSPFRPEPVGTEPDNSGETEPEGQTADIGTEDSTEPVTEKVTETVTEPITEKVTEKITEPVTEKVTEKVTEPVTEKVTEKVTEPVTEKVTEKVTEPVAEPVTEKVTEPVTEKVTEPVKEPVKPARELHRTDIGVHTDYRGGWLDLRDYPTKKALSDAAKKLRESGYTAVTVDFKRAGGMLGYASAVSDAKTYGALDEASALTASEIVKTLHEADLFVTGRFSVFCDDCFAKKNNAPDVLMNKKGFRYSDGLSRWASVQSKDKAWAYMLSLLEEIGKSGVDEVLFSDFGLPGDNGTTAYVLSDKTGYMDAPAAFLAEAVKKLPGIAVSFAVDAQTLLSGTDAARGYEIMQLAKLSTDFTVLLRTDTLADGMKLGSVTLANVETDPASAVSAALNALKNTKYSVRPQMTLTGKAKNDRAQTAAAAAFGTGVFQFVK